MDVGFNFNLPSVFMILFTLFFKDASCQVYSWSVVVPLNISVCSNSLSNPLTLDWTYTPATPDPLIIEWSKQGTGGTFSIIASYSGGKFTTSTGRVSRTGSTAEIAIQGPLTVADGGVYQVAVTASGGASLSGFANVIFPVVNEPVNASHVETATNACNVTCFVDVSPPVTLQLKKGNVLIDSAPSDRVLSSTQSSAGIFQCSVTGPGSECVTPNSTEVTCIEDNPTSTPEGSTVTVSTTPTPGICKNHLCYLFLLLLLPFIAIIVVVVCYCRKKKKRSSHTNTNAMKPIREQNESMSPEDQVNNDKSGQMRL